MPNDVVDFSSLPAFKLTIKRVNFSEFHHIAVLLMVIGYLNFVFFCVCVLFVFIRAAVSAGYFSLVVPATLVAGVLQFM